MHVDHIIHKNILATITYYDVLDRTLTAFEVWKDLIRCSADHTDDTWTLANVFEALRTKEVRQYVGEKNGFYFLHGREMLVDVRRTRAIISLQKKKRVERIVKILRMSPFVRMVCVTGRLSYNHCEKESDLDLLVVYKHGHIWTGRFFITILAHVCGFRRHDEQVNDRACLNYHITTQSLTVPTKDLFAAHEYSYIFPVFDQGVFAEFCMQNQWIRSYKPHFMEEKYYDMDVKDTIVTKSISRLLELILGDRGMEKRLKKIQEKKIKNNPKTQYKGGIILFSDQFLVFLPKPHGPRIFEEYKKRFTALEIDF
jgi:hypothetical protein